MGLANFDQPGDNTFRVTASEHEFSASMVVELGTQDEVAALFPKSYQVRPTTLGRETLQSLLEVPAGLSIAQVIAHPSYGNETVGYVTIRAGLSADGVNGGKNETGIKRVKSFLAKAEALGFRVEWNEPGQSFGVRAVRFGGGSYTADKCCLTKAQAEALLS
jgi:hypothetical protein